MKLKPVSIGYKPTYQNQMDTFDVITDSQFVEVKERLGSFLVVRATSLAEATALAHGYPALDRQGSVEIRAILG